MLKTEIPVQALILAAGASSRMGRPKLSLAFDKNNSFIEHIAGQYDALGCTEIRSVVNLAHFSYYRKALLPPKATYIINKEPQSSRFYSLQLGLQAIKNPQAVFVHNVDNPFVEKDVLQKMIALLDHADYVTPRYRGRGGHPVLLSKKVVQAIVNTKGSEPILSDFLKDFRRKSVAVSYASILTNINTPQAYTEFVRKRTKNITE